MNDSGYRWYCNCGAKGRKLYDSESDAKKSGVVHTYSNPGKRHTYPIPKTEFVIQEDGNVERISIELTKGLLSVIDKRRWDWSRSKWIEYALNHIARTYDHYPQIFLCYRCKKFVERGTGTHQIPPSRQHPHHNEPTKRRFHKECWEEVKKENPP